MTIGEYIKGKLKAWNISEVNLADFTIKSGLSVDEEYSADKDKALGEGLISLVEELMLSPIMKNVSENGFSISWDFSNMGKYYMWLCRRYGKTPDNDVMAALGLSTIIDMTDIW